MTDQIVLNTLIVKRKKISYGLPLILFWVFTTLVACMSIWCISHPWHGSPDILIAHWLISMIYPFMCLAFFVELFPNQGHLILSPEGFEIKAIYNGYRRQYRWDEVVGFYAESKPRTYKQTEPLVCFDKTDCFTKKRKQVIPFFYEMGSQALVDTLNEWKEKYAPNPEGVVLDPLPELPGYCAIGSRKGQKILRWIVVVTVGLMIAMIIGAIVYGKLTHENHTQTTVIKVKSQ